MELLCFYLCVYFNIQKLELKVKFLSKKIYKNSANFLILILDLSKLSYVIYSYNDTGILITEY